MKKKEFNDLMNQLIRINNQFTAVRRTQSYSQEGEIYHPAEMNVLTLLSEKPWITVSDVASSLFISRSAASQIIKKLAVKELIVKKRNLMNERVVNLSLSPEGDVVVKRFKDAESASMEEFFKTFSEIDDDDMRIARGFLYKLEKALKVKKR
jgi:DNA-binding MarR family transcriptional regulator